MNREFTTIGRVLLITFALLALFTAGMKFYTGVLTDRTTVQQMEILQNAVTSAMRTCYAIEGKYPDNIDYLIDNYGLRYNESRFHIYYDQFASNVMPDVRIIERGR